MALRYSALLLALPILHLCLDGVSIASINRLLTEGSPLFSKAHSNISTLMATKMENL